MLSDDLIGTITLDPLRSHVPSGNFTSRIEHENRVIVCVLHKQAKALLSLTQRRFRLLLGGNVPDDRQHDRTLRRIDRAEHDIHGELCSVLTAPKELQPRTHRTHTRVSTELVSQRGMPLPKTLRNQDFDRMA